MQWWAGFLVKAIDKFYTWCSVYRYTMRLHLASTPRGTQLLAAFLREGILQQGGFALSSRFRGRAYRSYNTVGIHSGGYWGLVRRSRWIVLNCSKIARCFSDFCGKRPA